MICIRRRVAHTTALRPVLSVRRHAARLALLLTVLHACAVPLAYFDNTTFTRLTDLKVDAMALVQTFDVVPVLQNTSRIDSLRLDMLKAYEYERGKGSTNLETLEQITKIIGLFDEDVKSYRERGPGALGPRFFQEAATVLGQAFDIAIATENLKNRDRRREE